MTDEHCKLPKGIEDCTRPGSCTKCPDYIPITVGKRLDALESFTSNKLVNNADLFELKGKIDALEGLMGKAPKWDANKLKEKVADLTAQMETPNKNAQDNHIEIDKLESKLSKSGALFDFQLAELRDVLRKTIKLTLDSYRELKKNGAYTSLIQDTIDKKLIIYEGLLSSLQRPTDQLSEPTLPEQAPDNDIVEILKNSEYGKHLAEQKLVPIPYCRFRGINFCSLRQGAIRPSYDCGNCTDAEKEPTLPEPFMFHAEKELSEDTTNSKDFTIEPTPEPKYICHWIGDDQVYEEVEPTPEPCNPCKHGYERPTPSDCGGCENREYSVHSVKKESTPELPIQDQINNAFKSYEQEVKEPQSEPSGAVCGDLMCGKCPNPTCEGFNYIYHATPFERGIWYGRIEYVKRSDIVAALQPLFSSIMVDCNLKLDNLPPAMINLKELIESLSVKDTPVIKLKSSVVEGTEIKLWCDICKGCGVRRVESSEKPICWKEGGKE